jgi:hypothetical protein
MVAHNHIAKEIETFFNSTIGQIFQNQIPINLPGEYISPAYDLESQKVRHFLISTDLSG